jgi:hypothetical protein
MTETQLEAYLVNQGYTCHDSDDDTATNRLLLQVDRQLQKLGYELDVLRCNNLEEIWFRIVKQSE